MPPDNKSQSESKVPQGDDDAEYRSWTQRVDKALAEVSDVAARNIDALAEMKARRNHGKSEGVQELLNESKPGFVGRMRDRFSRR